VDVVDIGEVRERGIRDRDRRGDEHLRAVQERVSVLYELVERQSRVEGEITKALKKLDKRVNTLGEQLSTLVDRSDEIARQGTLVALADEVGHGDEVKDVIVEDDGDVVVERAPTGDTVHDRLRALQATTDTLATASALGTLAELVGTESPLSGMRLWIADMMDLMIAQSRANEMLDRNGAPESIRPILMAWMVHPGSSLRREGYVGTQPMRKTWGERGTVFYGKKSFILIRPCYKFNPGGDMHTKYAITYNDSGASSVSFEDDLLMMSEPCGGNVAVAAERGHNIVLLALGGTWTGGWNGESPMIALETTTTKITLTEDVVEYASVNSGSGTEVIPNGTRWHMIVGIEQS
jgi:hypothetical protein